MDYSNLTLGELLSSENETIRRNALSILKTLQRNHYSLSVQGDKKALVGFNEKGEKVNDRIEVRK